MNPIDIAVTIGVRVKRRGTIVAPSDLEVEAEDKVEVAGVPFLSVEPWAHPYVFPLENQTCTINIYIWPINMLF